MSRLFPNDVRVLIEVVVVVWFEVMVFIMMWLEAIVSMGWVMVIVASEVSLSMVHRLLSNVLSHLVAHMLGKDFTGWDGSIATLDVVFKCWVVVVFKGSSFYSSSQKNGLEESSHCLIW